MTTIICDFMSDPSLEKIANNLCNLKPEIFSHHISHRKPNPKSNLAKLEFIDATYLYRHQNLSKSFVGLTISTVSLEQTKQLLECQSLFLSAIDRTTPIPESIHSQQKYFWDLVGYYISFFHKNKDVDSLVFDNTPHIAWDICLFYVAKMLNIKVLMLQKTGISGYIYIDEDFRHSKADWHFDYKGLINPLAEHTSNDEILSALYELSFTKGQVNGMWPKDMDIKTGAARKTIDFLRTLGFQKVITFFRIWLLPPPNNYLGATEITTQRTILAGMYPVNRYKFYQIHKSYVKNLKKCRDTYYKNVQEDVDLNSPFIYLSLHFQPERTTLPEGLAYDDQVLVVRTLAEALPKGWHLVVKEHPRQFKYDLRSIHSRDPIDYERISKIDRVSIISNKVQQIDLIKKCKLTATISGSVSWEGLLEGKPSLIFSENWHACCKSTKFVSSVNDAVEAIDILKNKSAKEVEGDISSFVATISNSLVNAALNHNHLRMFFSKENKKISTKNISSAIIQRLL